MIARRTFLAIVTGDLLGAPLAVEAQPAGRVHRIGFLGDTTPALEGNLAVGFLWDSPAVMPYEIEGFRRGRRTSGERRLG
jgi:hypothetical protein